MNFTKYLFYILAVAITGFSLASFKTLNNINNTPNKPKPTQNQQVKQDSYPLTYINKDNDLILTDSNNNSTTLVKENGTYSTVTYANNSYDKFLFTNENELYLYNLNDSNNIRKLANDPTDYFFTDDDKYIIYTTGTESTNLYYYNMKKDPIKIDSDIQSIKDYSNNYIIYTKDDSLYIQKLDYESNKAKITKDTVKNIKISNDEKKVLYLDYNDNLYSYSTFQNESTKILSEVKSYIIDKTGTKMYYVSDQSSLYYYNNKNSKLIAENIKTIEDDNVEKEQVLYTTYDDNNKSTLYYVKGDNKPTRIDTNITNINASFVNENELFYHYKEDDIDKLKYVKVNNKEVIKMSELTSDVGIIVKTNDGILFTSKMDNSYIGSLYIAKDGKVKKIDEKVYTTSVTINNDGTKYYYIKNYNDSNNIGDLYVSSGDNTIKIDSDIYTNYIYANDNLIYYIKDYSTRGIGNLYKYTDKEVKIAEDVRLIKRMPNNYNG